MSKRVAEEGLNGNEAYLKRQKLSGIGNVSSLPEIRTATQLRQTLAFDQDLIRAKKGVQAFKSFLDAFSQSDSDHTLRTNILKQYLESQIPDNEDDSTSVYLNDLMQTWSFAAQSNNEGILSAVPAVLALLLRTISGMLEFVPYGLRLSRTLLQKRQLELLSRGLKSNKTKDFLISPALRLLREMVLLDGGALSKQVFRARDHVFQNLPRNLNLRHSGEEVESRKRPSVRANAVRFVLVFLRLLPANLKKDLINQRDIMSALTKDLKEDPPHIVRDILDTLQTSVLRDESLPRDVKIKIINAQLLSRVSMLYRYDLVDDDLTDNNKAVDTMSHEFLTLACTSPTSGVLNRQTGYYPRGVDPDETYDLDIVNTHIDLGIDSIEWINQFTDKVPVRNTILSEFVQNLRPWSDIKQNELLLSIFKVAPELVAEYFFSKTAFSFDPKLTTTWIGYSTLIFSSIQLSVPQFFGHQDEYARLPPPTAVVLENLLPQPLTQKVLRACLIHEQKLITFFAVRLLSVAFSKLQRVLQMYREAGSGARSLWGQAAERLVDKFCERCPSMKDIIFAYRRLTDAALMQREACSKLLVLYYEMAPRIALEARFDVSDALAKALNTINEPNGQPENQGFRILELENLFRFAHFSPGMKWFGKTQGFDFSPFTTMLKLTSEAPRDIPLNSLRTVLESVAVENDILQNQTEVPALDALILSLQSSMYGMDSAVVYRFVDNCVNRCAQKPINYIFASEEANNALPRPHDQDVAVSLLNFALVEQWPYLVKSAEGEDLSVVAHFLSQNLARSIKIGEDKRMIDVLIKELLRASAECPVAKSILEKSTNLSSGIEIPPQVVREETRRVQSKSHAPSEEEMASIVISLKEQTALKPEDHNALVRWATKEVDEAIEGGHIAALIMLLSSEHLSVRKEAATNIAKFAAKLKVSSFEEKDQVWLLLSEVNQTAKGTIDQRPLVTVISAFAAHAVAVLIDPLHCLYPKINKFLSQGPSWDATKVPLLYRILDEAPSLDDAHYTEMSWLLGYLLTGLRTTADMNVFRKRRVFEKLFSVYTSPYLGINMKDKILRLLFKGSTIDGGSTTLITRFSTMTWLQAQVALNGGTTPKVLMETILRSSDQKRVGKWSASGVDGLVQEALEL